VETDGKRKTSAPSPSNEEKGKHSCQREHELQQSFNVHGLLMAQAAPKPTSCLHRRGGGLFTAVNNKKQKISKIKP